MCRSIFFFFPPLPLRCCSTLAADYARISGDKQSRGGFSALRILGTAARTSSDALISAGILHYAQRVLHPSHCTPPPPNPSPNTTTTTVAPWCAAAAAPPPSTMKGLNRDKYCNNPRVSLPPSPPRYPSLVLLPSLHFACCPQDCRNGSCLRQQCRELRQVCDGGEGAGRRAWGELQKAMIIFKFRSGLMYHN